MAQVNQVKQVAPITKQPKTKFGLDGQVSGFGKRTDMSLELEPLDDLTTVMIRPKVIELDDLTGWEQEMEFDICTVNGDLLYKVIEETDCCARCLCGNLKPFSYYIKTLDGRTIIQLTRMLTAGSYCCSQFVQTLQVFCPPGQLIGTVERNHNIFLPRFEVKDNRGEIDYTIDGPYCVCSCCGEVDYEIFSRDKSAMVGKVSKLWSGISKAAFSKTETFGIEFPVGLSVKKKINLMAAAFLIDFIYYDH